MTKSFAPDYLRNENGLILFPRDSDYRKILFPRLILADHVAKANIYLVQACVEYISESGQIVMDIMSGTGTIMTAALIGRRVVCVEIEQEYQDILHMNLEDLNRYSPGIADMVTIVPGDCFVVLPLPVDHIVFSPPYASILRSKNPNKFAQESGMGKIATYSKSSQNVGNLSDFLYTQRMEQIYTKCFQSLQSGGTLTIIIKDHMENGKRVKLGLRAKQSCEQIGFESVAWHRWLPPGSSFVGIRKARGETVVLEEDIIIMRRP